MYFDISQRERLKAVRPVQVPGHAQRKSYKQTIMTRNELQSLCDNAKAWEAEMERKYGRWKSSKSDACIMVLELMGTDEYYCNYCGALDAVLTAFPKVNRDELEKELDKYI